MPMRRFAKPSALSTAICWRSRKISREMTTLTRNAATARKIAGITRASVRRIDSSFVSMKFEVWLIPCDGMRPAIARELAIDGIEHARGVGVRLELQHDVVECTVHLERRRDRPRSASTALRTGACRRARPCRLARMYSGDSATPTSVDAAKPAFDHDGQRVAGDEVMRLGELLEHDRLVGAGIRQPARPQVQLRRAAARRHPEARSAVPVTGSGSSGDRHHAPP